MTRGTGFETEIGDGAVEDIERLLGGTTKGHRSGARSGRASLVGRGLWALAAIPWLALLLLASMALRVRLADGAWPSQNQPDPKELGIHNTITVVAILASFAVALLVPLGALVAFSTGHRPVPVRPPVVAVVGFAAVLLVLWADVGGLGDWLAD